MRCENIHNVQLVHCRNQWRIPLNVVIRLRFRRSFSFLENLSVSRRICIRTGTLRVMTFSQNFGRHVRPLVLVSDVILNGRTSPCSQLQLGFVFMSSKLQVFFRIRAMRTDAFRSLFHFLADMLEHSNIYPTRCNVT